MADVFVSRFGVPKKYRNGKIYGGNSFNTTNTFSSSAGADARHIEAGIVDQFPLRSNYIVFSQSFTNTPILVQFKLFKMVENSPGVWVMQDVLFTHPSETWIEKGGFIFKIDDDEDLTGVQLHYTFTE